MTKAADEWQSLCDSFAVLTRHVNAVTSVNLNTKSTKTEAKAVAQKYFRECRPLLEGIGLDQSTAVLDDSFAEIIKLSAGNNAASSYKALIKTIRKVLSKVTAQIELNQSVARVPSNNSEEDEHLIRTLENLVPFAALSYRQAVADLNDDKRLSFRGSALELREALRETLDHLAPDSEVTAAPGFVQEKDRHGPTMKQKVRFILKARGQGKTLNVVPEQAVTAIDETIGT